MTKLKRRKKEKKKKMLKMEVLEILLLELLKCRNVERIRKHLLELKIDSSQIAKRLEMINPA